MEKEKAVRSAWRRTLLVAGVALAVPIVFAVVAYGALYFTTWGIPNTWALKFYAPDVAGRAAQNPCIEPREVVPVASLTKLLPALDIAEGPADMGRYATTIGRAFACQGSSRTAARRLRELRLAVQARRRFTPNEQGAILLNTVTFGDNINGVGAASQHFFGKPVEQLDQAQIALLVGLIQRPSFYSPTRHPDRALARRNDVLDRMYAKGLLKRAAWIRAKTEPINALR